MHAVLSSYALFYNLPILYIFRHAHITVYAGIILGIMGYLKNRARIIGNEILIPCRMRNKYGGSVQKMFRKQ